MSRKIVIFLVLIVGSSNLLAQKFGDGNPIWNYSAFPGWGSSVFHAQLIVKSDTTFLGKTCKILSTNGSHYASGLPYKNMFCQDSNKVLFWSTSKNSFQTLYDFDAIKGEGWDFWVDIPVYPNLPDSMHVEIISTSFITINNQILRVQEVKFTGTSDSLTFDSHIVIERIGSKRQLFPFDHRGLDGDYVEGIRCFQDDSLGLNKFRTTSCNYTEVGVEAILSSKIDFQVYPNSNNGQFKIRSSQHDLANFLVLDLQGKVVVTQMSHVGEETEIILENPVSGLYILEFTIDNGEKTRQKVIVR